MKILGALLELPAKQHCQFSPFTSKLSQIGQTGSQDFDFFNCHVCRLFISYEIHCYFCPHMFCVNYFNLSQCEWGSPFLPLGSDGPVTHSFEPEMPLVLLEITRQVANAENFASHRGKIMFVKKSKLVSGSPGGLL